ncbi:MAG: arginase family protein [Actinomycetota bacterium]
MDVDGIPFLHRPPAVEPPAFHDPDFPTAAQWLGMRPEGDPALVVLGVPFSAASISRAACDMAPAAVRRALGRFSVWSSDRAVSVEGMPVLDAGDVDPDGDDVEKTQRRIAEVVAALPRSPLIVLGGDNSITVGAARGARADGLLTFDAHHDCRDPALGLTNGCPVRQLIEGGIRAVVQVGIHGFANAEAHARWALDHKVHVIKSDRVRDDGIAKTVRGALRLLGGARRVWVDFDIDVLDRAFAPGAPAAMPGGLTPAHLEEAAFLLGKEPQVVGIDITEVDPSADVGEVTVRTAGALVMNYAAGVAAR